MGSMPASLHHPASLPRRWSNPLLSLKALAYHDDPALAELSAVIRHDLIAAIKSVDPERLPMLTALRPRGERP